MYFPKREEKILTLPKYSEKETSKDTEELKSEKILELKQSLEAKYIDKKLLSALEKISLSQVNRFYSILEDRKFSFDSNYIKNIVDKQINKKLSDKEKNEDFEQEKNFYEFFRDNFLTEEFFKDRNISFALMSLIKSYVEYYIGDKRLKEKRGR